MILATDVFEPIQSCSWRQLELQLYVHKICTQTKHCIIIMINVKHANYKALKKMKRLNLFIRCQKN